MPRVQVQENGHNLYVSSHVYQAFQASNPS
jgi:hypothetical protein